MTPSIDFVVSSLLCAEDNNSIFFDDDDDHGFVGEFEDTRSHRNHQIVNQNRNLFAVESLNRLPLQSDECLALMIERECEYLPDTDYLERLRNGYLDLAAREKVIDWIGKVHAYFSFGPLSAYLSVNYLDRFLSAYELPKGKDWMMQLAAVACLSLAAKMEETEVPLSLDLQVAESKFVFEPKTIQRMELLVLSSLKWRMQAVTPFSFIDHFLRKTINGDQITSNLFMSRSTRLILSTVKEIDFLEFKPSEIAAAVAIAVARETQTVDTEESMSVLNQHVQKDRVLRCIELIHYLPLLSGSTKCQNGSDSSVPERTDGVLDAACLSHSIDDSTVVSSANSSRNTIAIKRRRLNRPFEAKL